MKKITLIITTLFIAPLLVGFSQSIFENIIDENNQKEKLKIRIKTIEESYHNSFNDVFNQALPPFDSLEEKQHKFESQVNYYSALIHIKEQLTVISNDKDYFSHLSNPMQKQLSKFILDIEEELLRDNNSISNEEIRKCMIAFFKQEECFISEWRYQNGEIQKKELEEEIDNILYPGYRNISGNY